MTIIGNGRVKWRLRGFQLRLASKKEIDLRIAHCIKQSCTNQTCVRASGREGPPRPPPPALWLDLWPRGRRAGTIPLSQVEDEADRDEEEYYVWTLPALAFSLCALAVGGWGDVVSRAGWVGHVAGVG